MTDKRRKKLNQNLSALLNSDGNLNVTELRNIIRDLVIAVTELQQIGFIAANVDASNNPVDGEYCNLLDGVYLKLVQDGTAPNVVKVRHKLGRIPQGAIFTQQTATNRVYIEGDPLSGITPATATEVLFQLNGSIGDVHYCILV